MKSIKNKHAIVTEELFENGATVRLIPIKKSLLPDELANVTYSEGVTKNTGNYESFRLSISISMPCHKDDILKTYRTIRNKTHDYLNTRLIELGLIGRENEDNEQSFLE